jgi:hypothetical protein
VPHPLELKILSALRYLGRGWTFNELAEAPAIAGHTMRPFFMDFISWGAENYFQEYVVEPADDHSSLPWQDCMVVLAKLMLYMLSWKKPLMYWQINTTAGR